MEKNIGIKKMEILLTWHVGVFS